jgi:hypothetical protein
MAVCISILNNKGGTGKTTTALNLGAALVQKKNKVLLVDTDSQCNLTSALGFFNPEKHLGQLLVKSEDIHDIILNKDGLSILCAKNKDSIDTLKQKIMDILITLERPFHAFNCDFESGVFFHNLNKKIIFDKELNREKYEAKKNAVSQLKIPQYDDPFFDNGKQCMESWLKGEIDKSIAHNRSCLLKERDILLKRGFRNPDELKFKE